MKTNYNPNSSRNDEIEKSKLDLLLEFDEVVERIERNPTPASYWVEEEKRITELNRENQGIYDSLKMSPEKYREPFTI